MAEINLVKDTSKTYRKVQSSIWNTIAKQLPEGATSSTEGERAKDKLNFALFIAQPTDVLMSHGVADKNYLFRKSKKTGKPLANKLKHLLVPGEWLKRKILANPEMTLTEEQIHTVGWPRLDALLAAQAARAPSDPTARPKVLWAPSHNVVRVKGSVNTSSYPELGDHLAMFREHFDVEVSLHPSNRKDKKPTGNQLVEADYVLSDMGTMVYEAWALGKPVIFPSWMIGENLIKQRPGSAEAAIFEHEIGLHAQSPEQIVEMVMSRPVIDAKVSAFLDDYLDPAWAGSSAKRIADLLTKFAGEMPPTA